MKDEVLNKAISSDTMIIPRYDVVLPDGTKVAENAQLILKNPVVAAGTPLNKENLLSDSTARSLGIDPQESTPDDALRAIRNSVGYCPRIRVNFTAGGTVYVRDNITNTTIAYTVPSTGYVIADATSFDTYSVWGVAQGITSTTETINVDAVKMYNISILYYTCTWKFTVNAEVGATITVKHTDGLTITGRVNADKTCSITLPKTGTYTATGSYDGCTSDKYTFTATDSHNGNTQSTTMKWITVTVNVVAGSTVVITGGGVTKGGTATNGTLKVWLPSMTSWFVTCTLNNKSTTETLVANAYSDYVMNLRYYVVYGVRIPLNNSTPTSPEYTNEAVGMTSGYNSWATNSLVESIKPCVLKDGVVQYYLNKKDLTKKVDGSAATINSTSSGDVMLEIPKIGYRMYSDSNYQYVQITDNPNNSEYCYLAHSLDSVGDCDKIYIGIYAGHVNSNKMYSISGATIGKNISMTEARTYAQARGTGYQLTSFYPWTLLQCLFTVIFKNLNSDQAIGWGLVNGTLGANTGANDAKGPCYGASNGGVRASLLNIEDPWGNVECLLDGVCTDASKNVLTAFKDFNNTGSGYPYTNPSNASGMVSGYMNKVQGTNALGFLFKENKGSSSTYYCDEGALDKSSIAKNSTSLGSTGYQGIFSIMVSFTDETSKSTYSCGRLLYKHKA